MITVAATIATWRRSSCDDTEGGRSQRSDGDGTARSGGRTRCERMTVGPSLLRRVLHASDRVDDRVHERAAGRAHFADVDVLHGAVRSGIERDVPARSFEG